MANPSREIKIDETGPDFMLDSLGNYMSSSLFADVVLISKERKRFLAHSAILAPASRLLARLLRNHGLSGGLRDDIITVMLPDVSNQELQWFLSLVYIGQADVDSENKESMMKLVKSLVVSKDIMLNGELLEIEDIQEDEIMEEIDDDEDQAMNNGSNLQDSADYDDHWSSYLEPQTEITVDESWTNREENNSSLSPVTSSISIFPKNKLGQETLKKLQKFKPNSTRPSTNVNLKIDSNPISSKSLPKAPYLPPDIAMKLAQQPQISIEPSRNMLDKRTREMLDQSVWDQAAGRKCERCKCPNCMDPNINVFKGEKALHVCHYPECGKAYKKTSHLRAHLRGHIGDQPFICTWENCGRKFTRSDELHRHYRIHTGEKNHKCQYCGKCFSRSDHLKKHLVSHEKQMMLQQQRLMNS